MLTRTTSCWNQLCITLPKASRTAWDVKFSEGIRLMKCFCLRFSYISMSTVSLAPIEKASYILEDLVNSGVGMFQVCREELYRHLISIEISRLIDSPYLLLRLGRHGRRSSPRTTYWRSPASSSSHQRSRSPLEERHDDLHLSINKYAKHSRSMALTSSSRYPLAHARSWKCTSRQ